MSEHDWLSGGGHMGSLIRSMDWSSTPLGPVERWPQSLRTTVSLCLSSTFPILIAWGPQRVQIYNDTYRPICGEKHPASMGQPFNACWASALPAVGHIVDRAQAGEGSYLENLRMFLDRYGYLEEAWMTFSFSPIRDESGGVGGLFHPITEVTEKMLSARRTHAMRELAMQLSKVKSLAEIGDVLRSQHGELALDLPFLLHYTFDDELRDAHCVLAAGLPEQSALCPAHIALDGSGATWPVDQLLATGEIVLLEDVATRLAGVPCGPYPEPPRSALLIPLLVPGMARPHGCLVAGVSARRALDDAYRAFYELLGKTVASAVASVLTHEQEQRRVAAMAELDRAKTAFFSNVSHEFRTPLTLMLGPLEESLSDLSLPLDQTHRERLTLVHRNGLRLLKLVNTLLDFSRIEAGRVQASFEPLDGAALTRDLASSFRSAVERAGLTLSVHCAALPEPIWVDRDMWEKIVLNLLSNAFKHTFTGGITVALDARDGHAELTVSDTGTGIPRSELPRLFERFHRVQGARGRSFEGSGIGLALVQELVRLHGGTVTVESELDQGSTFMVRIPLGNVHLPAERLGEASAAPSSSSSRTAAFVQEVSGWIDGNLTPSRQPHSLPPEAHARSMLPISQLRILLADDNGDMREYMRRLLGQRFSVEVVPDGERALESVRAQLPDLILSDVMMPVRDGFSLLAALKADPRTASIPVILISARAGEEATLEGLQAGASDYLVKPFSARELLARVEGALRTANAKREVEREHTRLEAVLAALHDGIIFQDAEGVARYCNAASEQLLGLSRENLSGRTSMDSAWQGCWEDGSPAPGEEHAPMIALRTRKPVTDQVLGVRRTDGALIWLLVNAHPIFEADGALAGVVSSFSDITRERQRIQEARERTEFEQQLLGIVSHDLRTPLNSVLLGASHLTLRADQGENEAKVVRLIKANAERAMRLVHELLDFTQARLGNGIPVVRRPMLLEQAVAQVVEELRSAFPRREVHFTTEGDTAGAWDEDRLIQVVHNLGSNALKYGRSTARVSIEGRADEVVVRVHNDGEPIPAALLPRLFRPFATGEATHTGRSIGLGLFIVERIVAAHGGSVAVSSSPAGGTVFAVHLPRS